MSNEVLKLIWSIRDLIPALCQSTELVRGI